MAAKRNIIVSRGDYEQLQSLLSSQFVLAFADKPYLQSLRGELDRATLLDPEDIPPDVVTMNSTVRLREGRSRNTVTYALVYPEDADIVRGKLSVLAPLGTAILGYRVGDLVRWQVPSGLVRVRIEELVFQPERAGVAS